MKVAGQNLLLFAFLVLGAVGIVGALRRLPIAYGAYCLAALALPLSYPVTPQPLASLPALRGGAVPDLHVGGDVA